MNPNKRTSIALVSAIAVVAAITAGSGHTSAPPVGSLPSGPVSTITTKAGELVAVALPQHTDGMGWRIARAFNSNVLREVGEQSNIGGNLVVVFKATGTGNTSIIFALTRGERPNAAQSRRFNFRVS
jgi:hypothetical protein